MSKQAVELCDIIAAHPEWLHNPEKRLMIEKMAKRISDECKPKTKRDAWLGVVLGVIVLTIVIASCCLGWCGL